MLLFKTNIVVNTIKTTKIFEIDLPDIKLLCSIYNTYYVQKINSSAQK